MRQPPIYRRQPTIYRIGRSIKVYGWYNSPSLIEEGYPTIEIFIDGQYERVQMTVRQAKLLVDRLGDAIKSVSNNPKQKGL